MADFVQKTSHFIRHSISLKAVTIAILILILLIPATMIQGLIREREYRRNEVVSDITGKWGSSQTLTGPYLTVPYRVYYTDKDGKNLYRTMFLYLLPEEQSTTAGLDTEVRYRSLFEAVVYNSQIKVSGHFQLPDLDRLNISNENISWDKATLALGVSDMRGIRDKVVLQLSGKDYPAQPGLPTHDLAAAGISAQVEMLQPGGHYPFSYTLSLNGSQQLSFVPLAETNKVHVQSAWPSPSFNGAFLPEKREVSEQGFSADWKVLHLNRNYPQFWSGEGYRIHDSSFGVDLLLTANIYQKSMRLAKYSIMFLVFTFAAFFLSEVINRQGIHPIQYLLIGVAALIFYTLVLSLSEYINFNIAYIIAATAITLLITGYGLAIIGRRFALLIGSLLGILYAYLFLILQLEDYALVMGSIGLLIVVGAVMYVTRKIDWYEAGKTVSEINEASVQRENE